jgi:hypothetical protein
VRIVLAVAGLLAVLLGLSCRDDASSERPNFLIIVTDDQRYDTVGEYMPETQSRIFDDGVAYLNAFVTTPLCCPWSCPEF